MSKFNSQKITNLAGGDSYEQSPELELVSILLTSFADDSFYRSANDTLERLKELIKLCDKKFVAKAVVYARTQFGMRSITHVVASELAKYISGEKWAKDFYSAVVYRPDDMTEIISYHTSKNGKLSNAIKKGFAKAFDKFDCYQLAKYKGEGKEVKLIDVVNLIHPIPVEKNADAISALVRGELKSFDTWETELSKVGQNANSEEEKAELKKEAWTKLIRENKLGYFALLRNLRNIIKQAPEVINEVIETLTNENIIKKSLVFPFRFLTAFEEVQKIYENKIVIPVLKALDKAVNISLNNIPKFEGETLVVLDVSASMEEEHLGIKSPHIIGSLFAAVLVKSNSCDFMVFSDNAKYQNINTIDSLITISNSLRFASGGTNFHSIFETANKRYDRIIILSDMQGWINKTNPSEKFKQYRERTGANPFVYSIDLKGYGSMQFPEKKVFTLAGFSEKIFNIMKLMEEGETTLINEINKVVF